MPTSDYATFNHSRDMADQVAERLEEAGRTFASLPAHGVRPAGVRAAWPEMIRELEDMLYAVNEVVASRPTALEVTRMDRALAWLSLIDPDDVRLRRVIQMRLIVHPVSHSHRFSWEQVGEAMGIGASTAKRWHRRGCEVIGKKIASDANCVVTLAVFAV